MAGFGKTLVIVDLRRGGSRVSTIGSSERWMTHFGSIAGDMSRNVITGLPQHQALRLDGSDFLLLH